MTTVSEDIRDVLTLLNLVAERPCMFNKTNAQARGTGIAFAELNRAKKRLTEALEKVELAMSSTTPKEFSTSMGATPPKTLSNVAVIAKYDVLQIWNEEKGWLDFVTLKLAYEIAIAPSIVQTSRWQDVHAPFRITRGIGDARVVIYGKEGDPS